MSDEIRRIIGLFLDNTFTIVSHHHRPTVKNPPFMLSCLDVGASERWFTELIRIAKLPARLGKSRVSSGHP